MSEIALRLQGLFGARSGERQTSAARIAAPRIAFMVLVALLTLFGLLMIYSSSSISALMSKDLGYDAAYYLKKQLEFLVAGVVGALVLSRVDYRKLRGTPLTAACVVILALLLLVFTKLAGHEVLGASRWIKVGPFRLQPSEFAKVTVLLMGAWLLEGWYEDGWLDRRDAGKYGAIGIVLPLALIVAQPDKGTTGVLVITLMVMFYLSGMRGWKVWLAIICIVAVAMAYSLRDEYSRARIMTMFNPEQDAYGDGYQLIQGFYALGSGGITGVGLGMSRQKYNYLPMAHNDFIFTVVGEELGFVGTILLLAAFVGLLWAGFKIAENASDLSGRLIASGCVSLIVIQLILNVSGVLGVFPLSGKPVPFISYGGSSIITTYLLVGLVLSVSFHSSLPETRYDRRRSRLRLAQQEAEDDYEDATGSSAGAAMPRSSRSTRLAQPRELRPTPLANARMTRPDLRVVDGGGQSGRAQAGRVTTDANGRRRIDLGPDPAERLRGGRRPRS